VGERFEGLSRTMAGPSTRRGVLKMLGMTLGAGAVAVVLKPFRGDASDGVVCSGGTTAGHIPCAAGTTRCNQCCCKSGVACVNASTSTCGCPAGTTTCGKTCCKGGVACASAATSACTGTANAVACTGAGTPCGSICCSSGQSCSGGVCTSSSVTFTDAFTQDVTPTTQCTDWTNFRAALTGSYASVTIKGSFDSTGVTCSDTLAVNQIATALRTPAAASVLCNGRYWEVNPDCGGGVALVANTTAGTTCTCVGDHTVRPCHPNRDWGGAGTAVCEAPSQTLTVVFQ
jgi:hypothetical protein